jgi:hypothetical protein
MHKAQQMLRNCSGFFECPASVDVQSIAHIDHLPALLGFPSRSAGHLQADHDQSHPAQLAQQVGLDGSYEPTVVPVQQPPLCDRVSKAHQIS